jgi:hypothetical protein
MIDQNPQRKLLLLLSLLGWMVIGCTTIHPLRVEDQPPVAEETFAHTRFDEVLQKHVDGDGRVDYALLQKNPGNLEVYYRLVAAFSPDSHPGRFPSEDHKLAYWINAYNAGAIKTVLTYYPIDSVLAVKNPWPFFFLTDKAGFFLFQRLTFGGQTTSLYYLENQVIRKRFADPRIHFALNCASIGCPRLPRRAFTGGQLDQQLDHETRRFLGEERNFAIDHEARRIDLSSIFQWYQEDFTDWMRHQFPDRPATLLSYISLYLPPAQAAALENVGDRYRLRFVPYDWGLNDQNPLP